MSTRKPVSFIVTEDGVPCALKAFPETLGSGIVPRRGVLIKAPDDPTYFSGFKSADAAIQRALKLQDKLSRSLVADWYRIRAFVKRGTFKVAVVEAGPNGAAAS